jgi:hypothetical protein
MPFRKPVAAARKRASPRGRRAPGSAKRKRRLDPKAAADRASRLPHHPRYTAALLAQVRQRYETTPEPIGSMAADLGIAPGSLHRIARRHGWVRRNPVPPPRHMSSALRILEEAQALAGEGGAVRGGATVVADVEGQAVPQPTLPVVGNAATPTPSPCPQGEGEPAEFAASLATPSSAGGIPPSSAAPPSTIDRLERAVLAELATIEAMRAALGTMPQKPPAARETVRTLSMLTQTLQIIQRLRASAALEAERTRKDNGDDNDDLPADIEAFRDELARRIDAFVASRTGAAGAGGAGSVRTVDAPAP